jgi:hypothetical protein
MKRILTNSLIAASTFDRQLCAPTPPHQPVLEALTSIGMPSRHLEQIRGCHALLDKLSSVDVDLPHDMPLTPLPALVVGRYAKLIAGAGMAPAAAWLLALHLTAGAPDLRTCRPCQQHCADLLSGLTVAEFDMDLIALLDRHVSLLTVLKLADGSGIQMLREALGKFAPLWSRYAPEVVAKRVNTQLLSIVGAAVQTFRHAVEKNNAIATLHKCLEAANDVVKQGFVWSALFHPRMPHGPLYRPLLALRALSGESPSDMDQYWSKLEQVQRSFLHERTEQLHARLVEAGVVIQLRPPQGSDPRGHCELIIQQEPVAKVPPAIFTLFVNYLCARIDEGELFRGWQLAAYVAWISEHGNGESPKRTSYQLCLAALVNDPTLNDDEIFRNLILPVDDEALPLVRTAATECDQRLRLEFMSEDLRKRYEAAFTIFAGLIAHASRSGNFIRSLPTAEEMTLACQAGIRISGFASSYGFAFERDDGPTEEQVQTLLEMMRQRRAPHEGFVLLWHKLVIKDKSLADQRKTLGLCGGILRSFSGFPLKSDVMLVLARLHVYGLPRDEAAPSIENITRFLPRDRNEEIALLRERLPEFVHSLVREMPGALADVRVMHYLFSLAQAIGHPEFFDPLRAAMTKRHEEPQIARLLRSIRYLDQVASITAEVAQEAAQEAPKVVGMDIV